MKKTISKNNTSLTVLKNLIEEKFYNGYISLEKFELTKNSFPNNYKLIGVSNKENRYELFVEYKPPLNIAYKSFLMFCIFVSLVFLIKNNWIVSLVFLVVLLVAFIGFKIKSRAEVNQFLDKYLEFYKKRGI